VCVCLLVIGCLFCKLLFVYFDCDVVFCIFEVKIMLLIQCDLFDVICHYICVCNDWCAYYLALDVS
jgi:hypothetical protein